MAAPNSPGETRLVRELLRHLDERGDYETVFVDLEDAPVRRPRWWRLRPRPRRPGHVDSRWQLGREDFEGGRGSNRPTQRKRSQDQAAGRNRRGQVANPGRRAVRVTRQVRQAGGAGDRRASRPGEPAPQGPRPQRLQDHAGAQAGHRRIHELASQEGAGASEVASDSSCPAACVWNRSWSRPG